MIKLTAGTKEYVIVKVTDRLANLTTLDGIAATFDVRDSSDTAKLTGATATTNGMNVNCLIDTTNWTHDIYSLYIHLAIAPEAIKLGPERFMVT